MEYDIYTADNAEIPHIGVYPVGHMNAPVAAFYIAPDKPGGLTIDQAQNLAQMMCHDLNSWGQ